MECNDCYLWLRRARIAAVVALLAVAHGIQAADAIRWPDERQAGQFQCHSDFPLAPHQGLLNELSQLQQDLRTSLGAPASQKPVHLFLFEKKDTYQTYIKQYFPPVPYRRALFIKARGPGMVFAFQGNEFDIDVRHECTHALLHAWLPGVPLWLDEGLAEYFEMPREKRTTGNPHMAVVQAGVQLGKLPRLEELESLDNLDGMGREEYRDAWAWVHFMLHGPREANEEFLRYLNDLEEGHDPGRLSDRLRRRLPNLNRRLAEHFQE